MVTGVLDEKLVLGAIAWRDEAPGKERSRGERREEEEIPGPPSSYIPLTKASLMPAVKEAWVKEAPGLGSLAQNRRNDGQEYKWTISNRDAKF